MADEVINRERRAFLGTSALVVSSAVMGGPAMARPTRASTQAGAACTDPSGRRVDTVTKFFPFNSSSARPSIVWLI